MADNQSYRGGLSHIILRHCPFCRKLALACACAAQLLTESSPAQVQGGHFIFIGSDSVEIRRDDGSQPLDRARIVFNMGTVSSATSTATAF